MGLHWANPCTWGTTTGPGTHPGRDWVHRPATGHTGRYSTLECRVHWHIWFSTIYWGRQAVILFVVHWPRPGICTLWPMGCIGPPSVFVSSCPGIQPCPFVYVLSVSAFELQPAELSSCGRNGTALKAQNIYYLTLYGERWLIPGLAHEMWVGCFTWHVGLCWGAWGTCLWTTYQGMPQSTLHWNKLCYTELRCDTYTVLQIL